MSAMKITNKQRQHLLALNDKSGPRGAYGNGLHLGILNSLERKGLVSAWRGFGSIFSPRTSIKWRITEAGRAALANGQSAREK